LVKSKEMLRKRGLADAEKRADRLSTQGLIGLEVDGNHVTMVQLSCETDFVAKTDRFKDGLE
jgi:elongation factor Ts